MDADMDNLISTEPTIPFLSKAELERYERRKSSKVPTFNIIIEWKAQKEDPLNGGYNYDNLHRMFSKYGDVIVLFLSSTKGTAIVEFADKSAAETALLEEVGLIENPLTLRSLWNTQERSRGVMNDTKLNIGKPIFPVNSHFKCKQFVPLSTLPSVPHPFNTIFADEQNRLMADAEFNISILANLELEESRGTQTTHSASSL